MIITLCADQPAHLHIFVAIVVAFDMHIFSCSLEKDRRKKTTTTFVSVPKIPFAFYGNMAWFKSP